MVRRSWIVAAFSILAGAGCHAGRPQRVTNPDPPINRADIPAARYIEQHNQNAELVLGLEARPRIQVIRGDGKAERGRANGNLALEGERNFSLDMNVLGRKVADIGSNEKGFWFWVSEDPSKSIYVCDYENIDSCQLAITLQPDWILEAMGLRRYTADEARKISATTGTTPGTIVLTQIRKDPRGNTYTKETIINEATSRIMEHRLYSGYKKTLLANAVVTNYLAIAVPKTGNEVDPAAATLTAQIPENFKLNWKSIEGQEGFGLDITMNDVKLNPVLDDKKRTARFTEPKIAGTKRQDLALLDPATAPASRTYQSRPIPPANSGVSLGAPEPVPMGVEGATRRQIDPAPLSPDLSATPAQPAGIVGARVPRGSDVGRGAAASQGTWRSPTLAR